jgi:hypothetical protein
MNTITIGGYKNIDAKNPRRGYREPSVITIEIPDHRNVHFVRPNMAALNYPNFKKDVDQNAHVRNFNYVVKENAETFEKYIINVFSYTLTNTTLH